MVLKEEKREVMEQEKGRIGSGHSLVDSVCSYQFL